jgi:transcriptional regulator with XRE-family HTH domain
MKKRKRVLLKSTQRWLTLIGKRLYTLRKANGYSLRHLSSQVNISRTLLSRIEKGTYGRCTIGMIQTICDFYKEDVLVLMSDKGRWIPQPINRIQTSKT